MDNESWFNDDDQLLNEIRRGEGGGFLPNVPGYDVLDEVARGGQGVVYRATQTGTNRQVAIKVMYEGAMGVAERRWRFEREIELAASLQHPGIVRIYDCGVLSNGRLFTVMEFVEGETLERFVDSSSMTIEELVSLFVNVCDAICYAHRRGVIHRDLKPGNILVGKDGQPHILDFGVARSVDNVGPATRTGEFVGTLGFASPEQVGAKPNDIDTRTDVYSLGVILYRLITQTSPYVVEGPIGDVVREIQTVRPVPPCRLGSGSSRDLDTIVLRCLEKNPDDRYQSANALVSDLRRYLSGEALEARRDQTLYVLLKLIQRHRFKVAIAGAVAMLLLTFTVLATSLWQRAVNQERMTREIKVFWEDTLGSVSPSRAGHPVTFQDVMDEAVQWVAITTEGRPELEASLRTTIGNGYRNLGLFAKAETQLLRSWEVRRQVHGDQHPEVIQSLNAIALLRKSQGRIRDAEQGFLETLAARERLLGENHPDVAMSLQNLGRVMMEVGRLEDARKYFDRALSIRKRHFANDDPAIATVYSNQGDLARLENDVQEAIALHEKALAIRKSRLAETHPDIARSLLTLSQLFQEARIFDEARRLALEAKRLRQKTLPPEHLLVQEVNQVLSDIGAGAQVQNQ